MRVGVLQTVTQVAGLFAGLATIVYLTGAVVLALRLMFAHLPWGDVVSQLPREFILSTGAGQVLLPSLLVGALYGLFRILRDNRSKAPVVSRWRSGWGKRWEVVSSYLLTSFVMMIPLETILILRHASSGYKPQLERILAGYVLLLLAAVACHEVRAVAARHYKKRKRWNSLKAAAVMAGIYSTAAIIPMMVAASGIGFTSAKVCKVGGGERSGVLVGESADHVYLGENESGQGRHRIAVYPLTKVEELFIGDGASAISCEFAGASRPTAKSAGP